jgi:hypothetical protein
VLGEQQLISLYFFKHNGFQLLLLLLLLFLLFVVRCNTFLKQEILGEVITYFPVIWYGQHRKRRVQQFFYCCVCMPLPSNNRGIHIQTHRESRQRTEKLSEALRSLQSDPKLPIETNSRLPGVTGDTKIQTHGRQDDLISPLIIFKVRKSV